MSKFLITDSIIIENQENFQKQSYRNRCYIYGANGKQCLVIPLKKNHGEKTPIREVEIDHSMPWKKIHLKSIQSAYQTSPFYEYYADDFNEFYNSRTELLVDWNFNFLNYVVMQLHINMDIQFTGVYEKRPAHAADYRQSIHPKTRLSRPDSRFATVPYQQVFSDRFGFIPNLSIIDLLFNEGPNAGLILGNTVR